MGATGWGWSSNSLAFQSNWTVFTPGSCTIDTRTALPSCLSSAITLSVKPLTACFAPQ
jgi:hypothetical protein